MPARLDRLHDLFDVSAAICGIGEEMENSPVVPDIVGLCWQINVANVTDDPFDIAAFTRKSIASHS